MITRDKATLNFWTLLAQDMMTADSLEHSQKTSKYAGGRVSIDDHVPGDVLEQLSD
jgi:hypothetical protein